MLRIPLCVGAVLLALAPGLADANQSRQLTFEDRVRAQEAIERVYYSHQTGASRPFEEVVTREVLERKVRAYLKESVALREFWKTPVTAEMLRAEMQRMARQTQMPERLRELYGALGNDPFVTQECLVRPAMVSRLARSFFSRDERIHAGARAEAEDLRTKLLAGEIDPRSDHPRRRVSELVLVPEGKAGIGAGDRFQELPAAALRSVGAIAEVEEEDTTFVVRTILSEDPGRVEVANYTVSKIGWNAWWEQMEAGFNDLEAETTGAAGVFDLTDASTAFDSLLPGAAGCDPDDTWDNGILNSTPPGMAYHGAIWAGTVMLVFGSGQMPRYDPSTDTWSQASMEGAPSSLGGGVWTGREVIFLGGGGGRYDPVSDTWRSISTINKPPGGGAVWTGDHLLTWNGSEGGRYDPDSDTWSAISAAGAPPSSWGTTLLWTGRKMIVWNGGSNTGGLYDPASDSWAPMSSAPASQYNYKAFWTGSLMLIWWAHTDDQGRLSSGYRYDPVSDTWTPISSTRAPRPDPDLEFACESQAVWTGRVLVASVLWTNAFISVGGRYDPDTDTWTPMWTSSAQEMGGTSVVWTGSLMVVWGGAHWNGSIRYTNTGARYDPVSDSWTPTSTTPAPFVENSSNIVWTGDLMLAWGMNSATGGRYDAVLDSWTPISTTNAPSAYYGPTTVWSGDQMLVWGTDWFGNFGMGSRYDPATDTWTSISMAGAPRGGAAVWTGINMLIWRGTEGGRYDPGSDTWRAISTLNAPPAGEFDTVVWAGSSLLTWSGNEGGRYDPVSDTWTGISTVNAPSGRLEHTALWTGSRMIVWGGHDFSYNALNTGGRYDPATDTWTPTSTFNAPSARWRHTAVWTGSRMVAWGGSAGYDEDPMNSGARYDPLTDTWTMMSTKKAPSARYDHVALWIDGFMVIWGGDSGQSAYYTDYPPLNTGGRYVVDESQDGDHDGFSVCEGDCNDADPTVNPGAAEACNGIDDDCDGIVDEGLGPGTVEIRLDPVGLWPPDHRMVDIHAAVNVTGGCPGACASPPDVALISVTSSEPDDAEGFGDGETANDIQDAVVGSADFDFKLRAERDGSGYGRMYQVTYTVTDCFGDAAVGYGGAFVPHDESGQAKPVVLDIVARPRGSSGGHALEWNSVADATAYNVLRGRMSSIRAVGSLTVIENADCLARQVTGTSVSGGLVDENPAAGEAYFYLVEYFDGAFSGYEEATGGRQVAIISGDFCR